MHRSFLRSVPLVCLLLLAGCELALPGAGSGSTDPAVTPNAITPNAITGGAIEVTALDAAAGPVAPEVAEQTAKQTPADGAAPIPAPETDAPAAKADEVAPAVPPELKTDAQIACEKKGRSWVSLEGSSAKACVRNTRDAGKRCTRESQCESQCLARSGTCAPFDPLLGCNDVLQNNGARVTLCIE